MNEQNKHYYIGALIGVLLIGNLFFTYNYFTVKRQLDLINSHQSKIELNQHVLNFTEMFIKDVLQAESEVDFDTRLSLENTVRDLNDEEISMIWKDFTKSKTEKEAQDNVKKLLGVLVDKVQK